MNRPAGAHTALVTGGGSDIGSAIALEMAALGYDVAVAVRATDRSVDRLVDALKALGVHAAARTCDVADPASVQSLAEGLVQDGFDVDVLVNNAARRREQDFLEITEEDWRDVLDVTLGGAFRCSQAFAPHMLRKGWGRIVSIIGVRGQTGAPRRAHQVAAKSGLVGLTRALARELGPGGVTVNAVSPGTIETARDQANPSRLERRAALGVTGRFGEPRDVARAIAYLVGEDAAYVTGQVIGVNGGELMT